VLFIRLPLKAFDLSRLKEPIMKILKRTAFAHWAITPLKVNDLDEIWNSVRQMLGLAPADFGCDPRSSDCLRGSRNYFVW